jgi:hypothetical protein
MGENLTHEEERARVSVRDVARIMAKVRPNDEGDMVGGLRFDHPGGRFRTSRLCYPSRVSRMGSFARCRKAELTPARARSADLRSQNTQSRQPGARERAAVPVVGKAIRQQLMIGL